MASARVKPYKRNGIWLYANGTVIPDQARAASDVQYRESSNSLLALVNKFSPVEAVTAVDIENARVKLGWDAPLDLDIDAQIESLCIRLGITEPEHDPNFVMYFPGTDYKIPELNQKSELNAV